MKIKLAAFDVDGTLRDKQYLPESTKQALQALKRNGIAIALCTGRSEYEMASLREQLGIDWAVTCNGSHIGHHGKTVHGNAFAADTVAAWLKHAEAENHALLLYGARNMWTNEPDAPLFRQAQREIGFMEPEELRREDGVPEVYQCIVYCREEEETSYIGLDRSAYYLHRWRTWALDINPAGVNKAEGLRRLTGLLGISMQEVAAFGDGLNDLEMISSVGLGIAMGNACDELKQKAAQVTKPFNEDGIHYAVHQWIL